MDKPRLLLTQPLPPTAQAILAERFDVTVNPHERPLDAGELRAAMRDVDALCCNLTDRIDADILSVPDARLRIIANYGVGFDHIDLAAARAAGIVVTNTPGALTDATADVAILLMLMATRRAGEGERQVRSGQWSGWRPTHLVGAALQGSVLGLVGFGRIAQATAKRARSFGMDIAYHSRTRAAADIEAEHGARYVASIEALAAEADVLSLHCPGGAETYHLIDAEMLARMKPGSTLVNTARGSVVDEAALVAALRDGPIASAGLDVFEDEPRPAAGLLSAENVVLLPHIGSATTTARTAMGMRVVDNLFRFFSGDSPIDRVA